MRDRRIGASAVFFLDAVTEEKAEYERRQEEIPILDDGDPRFSNEKARTRQGIERAKRLEAEKRGDDFDVLLETGHRYSWMALPEELQDSHLAWALASENLRDYQWIIHHCTLLDIQEALALRKTTQWIREEND